MTPPQSKSPIEQARADAETLKSGGHLLDADDNRLKNATLVSVYGENAAVRHVIEGGQQFSAVGDAMLMAAPTVDRVKATLAASALENTPQDITHEILGAVDELTKMREVGHDPGAVVSAAMPHDISFEARQLLGFLHENQDNPKKLAAFIENYMQQVEAASGVPSQVRGRAFDIIQERQAARAAAETEKAAQQKAGVEAQQKTETTAAAESQRQDQTVAQQVARASAEGSGVQPNRPLSAMELAFQNAKQLKPKGDKNAATSNTGQDIAREYRASRGELPESEAASAGPSGAGREARPTGDKANADAVPDAVVADEQGNARPVSEAGNQGGVREGVNKGEKIARERQARGQQSLLATKPRFEHYADELPLPPKKNKGEQIAAELKEAQPFSTGRTPADAEPITVRNGEVHVGKYAALDYESGDPVKVKAGATPEDIRDALLKAGSLAKGQKIFGLKRETPAHADVIAKAVDMDEAQNAVVKTKDGELSKAEPALRETNEKIETMNSLLDCLK